MSDKPIRVLLVEDNPGDARLIREMLTRAEGSSFDVECLNRLSRGLGRLIAGGIDVVLLDIGLPDSQGLDTFIKVHTQASEVPIVILTALEDEALAIKAVRGGAQDYLLKGRVDGAFLARTIRYAIERKRIEEKLRVHSEHLEKLSEERERELREAQERLLKAERLSAIGQLASIVGHELRNPLGVMKNSVYYLKMRLGENADEKVMRHLDILEREVDRSDEIISDILDFSRGPRPPKLQRIDLNHLVKEAISRIEIPSKVEKIISLGEMPEMKADPDMVLRVLTNLILNGIQAMQEGGTLHVETRAGKDYIEVAIGDTGVGIPKENMNKLFTPLFSTKAKGVGLGLYISKRLVEAHGGSITVRSKQAEGSTFTVRLPISKKEQR